MSITQLQNKPSFKRWALFIFIVILPWLIISLYVLVLAHPRYISSAEVVVKQVGETNIGSTSGLGAILGVNSVSKEDAHYLTNYILSLDMVNYLDHKVALKKAYQADGFDPFFTLPAEVTQEELLAFYQKRVRVSLDEQTSILTVTTEGFTPDFALMLNQAILQESEDYVNRISQQVAKDQLNFAENQLTEAQHRLNTAKQQLLNYQNKNQIFDPETNAKAINALIITLQANLSALRTEERTLLSYLNPDAPQIVALRSQIGATEAQIKQEQAKLTSPTSSKLNSQAVQFETIKSNVEFSADLYKLSLASLEKARLEAFRKLKNLIVITKPFQAEEALYPRKVYVMGTSFILLCILYGFVQLVLAVIRDHKD